MRMIALTTQGTMFCSTLDCQWRGAVAVHEDGSKVCAIKCVDCAAKMLRDDEEGNGEGYKEARKPGEGRDGGDNGNDNNGSIRSSEQAHSIDSAQEGIDEQVRAVRVPGQAMAAGEGGGALVECVPPDGAELD